MLKGKLLSGDTLAGFAILALSLYIVRASIPWGLYGAAGPGPGFFPVIYGGLMLALALALLGRSLLGRPVTRPADPELPVVDNEGRNAAIVTWLALAASVPAMMVLGFLGGFSLLCLFLIRVIFKKPLVTSLIAAVAITAGLYLLFQVLLDLDLPAGLMKRR